MDSQKLPIAPENYRLKKAFLSTFDLDENLLDDLIGKEDVDKFLIVRGDGEYIPLKDGGSPVKGRIAEIFFESTKKMLPNGKFQPIKYHHAKIWLFIYENEDGHEASKLYIQSKNIYPYNSAEIILRFVGEKA